MIIRIVAIGLSFFVLPAIAAADDAQLKLPSFRHLQDKAIDSVDITIDGWPLHLAAALIPEHSRDGAAAKELLHGLKAVYVRSYTFDTDNAYSNRDIEAVRRQLKSPRWAPLAQVHNGKQNSDVDIYVSMDGEQADGLAIVATEPREFTILNIVGKIDPKNLGRIEKQLGLPAVGVDVGVESESVANN